MTVMTTIDAMTVRTITTVSGLNTTIVTIFLFAKPGIQAMIVLFNCPVTGSNNLLSDTLR